MKTPELDKEQAAREEGGSQQIGEFIDWMRENGFAICRWDERTERTTLGEEYPGLVLASGDVQTADMEITVTRSGWVANEKSAQSLLELYFDIDSTKAEEERRAILDEHRKKAL